jgi:hypothetical protein
LLLAFTSSSGASERKVMVPLFTENSSGGASAFEQSTVNTKKSVTSLLIML